MAKAKKAIKKKNTKVVKNKSLAKNPLKPTRKEGKLVGKVSHYFSNIKVAVIRVLAPIKQGDEIRIIGGEATDFNQKITSMQIDHKEVVKAAKGKSIGLKVSEKVREGYKIYKA